MQNFGHHDAWVVSNLDPRNMATKVLHHVVVAAHTPEPPSDFEWKEYVDAVESVGKTFGMARSLVSTSGQGGPNAKQRRELYTLGKSYNHRLSILTDSKVARGIVTAASWIGMPVRAFRQQELHAALNYIEVSHSMADDLRSLILEAKRELHQSGR